MHVPLLSCVRLETRIFGDQYRHLFSTGHNAIAFNHDVFEFYFWADPFYTGGHRVRASKERFCQLARHADKKVSGDHIRREE
jgi:hypothetical protein